MADCPVWARRRISISAANRLTQENAALKRRLDEAARARPGDASAADKQEIARLKEKNRVLHGQHAALTEKCTKLAKQLAAARAAGPGATPGEAALAKTEAKLAADPGEVGKMERQLRAAKTRIQNLQARLHEAWRAFNNKGIAVSKAYRRIIQKALHPDSEQDPARKKLLDKAAQIINPLFDALPTPGE